MLFGLPFAALESPGVAKLGVSVDRGAAQRASRAVGRANR